VHLTRAAAGCHDPVHEKTHAGALAYQNTMRARPAGFRLLVAIGVLALSLAALSIADMFLPRPYDGVVLEADAPGQLIVADLVAGTGADAAGIQKGDRILGIGRDLLQSPGQAASLLRQYDVGETVPYLLETAGGRREVLVNLGPRRIGSAAYVAASALGFLFLAVGFFVLAQQPGSRAAQVFFLLCTLFLLFLVCRLRPASYSGLDTFVLRVGTLALLGLPGAFLHFYLIFPRPLWSPGARGVPGALGRSRRARASLLAALYLLPVAVYLGVQLERQARSQELSLISGAPAANWWVLAVYMVAGLSALAWNTARMTRRNEQRGAALVAFASLFGVVPFLVFCVVFPSFRHTERLLYYGIAPLVLVPLTFAYAIVRFRLLDIRVILRKSLFYTALTATVTAVYAGGIALFNWASRDSGLAHHPYFPIAFALAIVLGLEPLRRKLQGPVDRFFLRDRSRLQEALVEMGEAVGARLDPAEVVRDLVDTLPRRLGLGFAALYRSEGEDLVRAAGPPHLPKTLHDRTTLHDLLRHEGSVASLERLVTPPGSPLEGSLAELESAEVEVLGDLSSARRHLGVILLSGKGSKLDWEAQELSLLRGLLAQAAIALETSLLLEERARRAELERDLEIAAGIQHSLLPEALRFAPGWDVAATCRPARHVGGDFFAEIPSPWEGGAALVWGDVAGKSIPAALMMMAAHEVLSSLAMTFREPERLLELANERLYHIQRRGFVALGYLGAEAGAGRLRYVLAGQPGLLVRRQDGSVEELPLGGHRLPLGALLNGARYRLIEVDIAPGELVLAYSDGATEARSPGGEMFGGDRLLRCLAEGPAEPEGVVEHVLAAVQRFAGASDPYDDVTLVALRRQPEVTSHA
jgi:serine phosphatase RsbU (regulator of sigma subunit)